VIPKSWSIRKTTNIFNTSYFIARREKLLDKEKGIKSDPDPKPGKSLAFETVQLVEAFYLSDEISRMMPGKKDFVSIHVQGERVHKQKQLVLCNLKEACQNFKNTLRLVSANLQSYAQNSVFRQDHQVPTLCAFAQFIRMLN